MQQENNHNLLLIKNSAMNEKNFEYLSEQLKYTGFGDKLNDDLRKQLEKQQPEFKLYTRDSFGKDTTTATLHFKKSEQTDMVFFNKYDLQLKKENNDNSLQQTFHVNKGNTITLKEGYNLLDGRAVHKTLTNKQDEKYNAWLQLDFKNPTQNGNYEMKQYHQNYGFDLEKVLAKYPIQELSNERYKESLVRSLEKGNLQSATFLADGEEKKLFITPNIAFKTLNAYDNDHQRVMLQPFTQKQEQKATIKPEQTVNSEQKMGQSEKQSAAKEQQQKQDNENPERKQGHRQKIKH
jgi:hypothetical protein